MQVGFSKVKITPELPCYLAGYDIKRLATKVHDDLYARILVFNNEIGIVVCDLIGVDYNLVESIKKQSGLKSLSVMATHTHAGPKGVIDSSSGVFKELSGIFGQSNQDLVTMINNNIVAGIKQAQLNSCESGIIIGKGKIDGVGSERHQQTLPYDNSLLVVKFTQKDKDLILYNYPCHPTVTGPDNLMVTADFPYAVEKEFQEEVIFVNSCCGDISSRFTRKESSFKQAEEYGKIIAKDIKDALLHPIYQADNFECNMYDYTLKLPVKKVKSVEEEQAQLEEYLRQVESAKEQKITGSELRLIESKAEGCQTAVVLAKALKGIKEIEVNYSLIHLANLWITTIPGELFSTLGLLLKQEQIEVFGYGNGYFLYLADQKAYQENYYEAMSSPFRMGVGEELIETIKEEVKKCQ